MKIRKGSIFAWIAMMTLLPAAFSVDACRAQGIGGAGEPEFHANKFVKIKLADLPQAAIDQAVADIEAAGVKIRTASTRAIRPGSIITAEVLHNDNRVRNEILESVKAVPGVSRVEKSAKVRFSLNKAIDKTRADHVWDLGLRNLPVTGRGVVVGIVDSGVEINHETFKNAAGTKARFRAIWDLSMDGDLFDNMSPVYAPITGTNLGGLECRFDDPDAPACLEEDQDWGGHGTHVLGIAAGRGTPGEGLFSGVAPEAELVAVKLNTGHDVEVIEGVNYIFEKATELGLPAVVNLSLGWTAGPRNGESLAEQYMDTLSGPGRIIVAAAGNDALDSYHDVVGFNFSNDGADQTALFYIFDYVSAGWPWRSVNGVSIEGYYLVDETAPADILKFRLINGIDLNPGPHYYPFRRGRNPCDTGPGGAYNWMEFGPYTADDNLNDPDTIEDAFYWDYLEPPIFPDCAMEIQFPDTRPDIRDGIIELDHTISYPRGDGKELRGFKISLTGHPGPADGTQAPVSMPGLWTIIMQSNLGDEEDLFVDLWIDASETVATYAPTFYFTRPDKTITVPCTADDVICVGAVYNTCNWNGYYTGFEGPWHFIEPECTFFPNGWGWMADWSGQGPRMDGALKPDLIAPGAAVISAFSHDRNIGREVEDAEGTSTTEEDIRSKIVKEGNGNYEVKAGTSMSSPLVAGTVALLLQVDPDMTPAEARQYLNTTTRSYNPATSQVWDSRWGYGRLDAYAAVMAAVRANSLTVTGAIRPDTGEVPHGIGEGGDDSKCFIATAAFGGSQKPAVDSLRHFRDGILKKSAPGRWLIKTYYTCSPPMAGWLESHPACQGLVRTALRPLIGFSYMLFQVGLLQLTLLFMLAGLSLYGLAAVNRNRQ